jgi:hypothetical protein
MSRTRGGRGLLAIVLVSVSCLVAACGGSSGPKSASAGGTSGKGSADSTQYVYAVKFSRCMRAHGVSQFPDPNNPGGWSSAAIDALNTSSPAFESATKTCDSLLPNEGQPTSADFEQTVVSGVKVAKCMRAHGIDMPDPQIQGRHLTIDMTHMNAQTPRFSKIGEFCDKRVFGYP